jgi:hypothetical protein
LYSGIDVSVAHPKITVATWFSVTVCPVAMWPTFRTTGLDFLLTWGLMYETNWNLDFLLTRDWCMKLTEI